MDCSSCQRCLRKLFGAVGTGGAGSWHDARQQAHEANGEWMRARGERCCSCRVAALLHADACSTAVRPCLAPAVLHLQLWTAVAPALAGFSGRLHLGIIAASLLQWALGLSSPLRASTR